MMTNEAWDKWDKVEEAYKRLEAKEPIAQVAQSYGLSPRALKVRVNKYARSIGVRSAIDSVLNRGSANASPMASGMPQAQSSTPLGASPPPQSTSASERAIASMEKLITPDIAVATIDAMQQSTAKMILYLNDIQLDASTKDVVAFTEVEKAMLEPWAGFAIEQLPDLIRRKPELGLYIGGFLLTYCLGNRAIVLMAVIKKAKALEKAKKETPKDDEAPPRANPGPV